jgi:hypothetical protein
VTDAGEWMLIPSVKCEVGEYRSETSCALLIKSMAIKALGEGLLSEERGDSDCNE